jgi:hypothetical protein
VLLLRSKMSRDRFLKREESGGKIVWKREHIFTGFKTVIKAVCQVPEVRGFRVPGMTEKDADC